MHVFEIDDNKALWLALRAEANDILKLHFGYNDQQTKKIERSVYNMVVSNTNNDDITNYHFQIYKEILASVISFSPTTTMNFNQSLIACFESLKCTYQTTPQQSSTKQYENASQKLFYTKVRPQLMALAANSQINLPICPNCSTKEFMCIVGIQTRSGDEAETLFPQCTKCKTLLKDHALN
tara:strand:- start:78 stop:620 length:543 start_codon:yes stop_codon:yes gene_type:complete